MAIASSMARVLLRRQMNLVHLCKYHQTIPLLVRGNIHLGHSLVTENNDPRVTFDVKPSDLIPPRQKRIEEITIDEYKEANVNDIQMEPLRNPDPEYIDEMGPEIPVAFNVAAYVDRNTTLQELVKLGVDLSIVEQNRNVVDFLLTADFDVDIAPFIQFLIDVGVHPSDVGSVITRHPFIFDELIINLRTRIEYLKSKDFYRSSIAKIITTFPPYLGKTVKEVDARLGHLQKEYKFSAGEIRCILKEYPQIVSLHTMQLRVATLAVKEEMGFTPDQMEKMLLQVPSLFGGDRNTMVRIFDHLHNVCKIDHEIMTYFPQIFVGQFSTIRKRTEYLRRLKRDQFNPSKPRFIPLSVLSEGSDELFVKKYAKTDLDDFNYFLKSD